MQQPQSYQQPPALPTISQQQISQPQTQLQPPQQPQQQQQGLTVLPWFYAPQPRRGSRRSKSPIVSNGGNASAPNTPTLSSTTMTTLLTSSSSSSSSSSPTSTSASPASSPTLQARSLSTAVMNAPAATGSAFTPISATTTPAATTTATTAWRSASLRASRSTASDEANSLRGSSPVAGVGSQSTATSAFFKTEEGGVAGGAGVGTTPTSPISPLARSAHSPVAFQFHHLQISSPGSSFSSEDSSSPGSSLPSSLSNSPRVERGHGTNNSNMYSSTSPWTSPTNSSVGVPLSSSIGGDGKQLQQQQHQQQHQQLHKWHFPSQHAYTAPPPQQPPQPSSSYGGMTSPTAGGSPRGLIQSPDGNSPQLPPASQPPPPEQWQRRRSKRQRDIIAGETSRTRVSTWPPVAPEPIPSGIQQRQGPTDVNANNDAQSASGSSSPLKHAQTSGEITLLNNSGVDQSGAAQASSGSHPMASISAQSLPGGRKERAGTWVNARTPGAEAIGGGGGAGGDGSKRGSGAGGKVAYRFVYHMPLTAQSIDNLRPVAMPPMPSPSNSQPATRSCAECMTTNTTEWRAGPHGKGTLCNACGLRYQKRKKRQAQDFTTAVQTWPSTNRGSFEANQYLKSQSADVNQYTDSSPQFSSIEQQQLHQHQQQQQQQQHFQQQHHQPAMHSAASSYGLLLPTGPAAATSMTVMSTSPGGGSAISDAQLADLFLSSEVDGHGQ